MTRKCLFISRGYIKSRRADAIISHSYWWSNNYACFYGQEKENKPPNHKTKKKINILSQFMTEMGYFGEKMFKHRMNKTDIHKQIKAHLSMPKGSLGQSSVNKCETLSLKDMQRQLSLFKMKHKQLFHQIFRCCFSATAFIWPHKKSHAGSLSSYKYHVPSIQVSSKFLLFIFPNFDFLLLSNPPCISLPFIFPIPLVKCLIHCIL